MSNSSIPSTTELPTIDSSELTDTTGGAWSQKRRHKEADKLSAKAEKARANGQPNVAGYFRVRAVKTRFGVGTGTAAGILRGRAHMGR
jgi:hypothetical protein